MVFVSQSRVDGWIPISNLYPITGGIRSYKLYVHWNQWPRGVLGTCDVWSHLKGVRREQSVADYQWITNQTILSAAFGVNLWIDKDSGCPSLRKEPDLVRRTWQYYTDTNHTPPRLCSLNDDFFAKSTSISVARIAIINFPLFWYSLSST